MKAYSSAKALLAAILLIGCFEFFIVLITGDNEACFFHNAVLGNVILWVARLFLLSKLLPITRNIFLPGYATVKDRMLERDELEEKRLKEEEAQLLPGKYALEV
ncbi:MAG TPA: hypothetical protein VEZ55_08430 [Chitinophagaceae bacterium]|jgi:hypothetical protein|nr:hypothetical protein [Chitinophagaceae bacterium]